MARCVRAVTIGAAMGVVFALGGGYLLLVFGGDYLETF